MKHEVNYLLLTSIVDGNHTGGWRGEHISDRGGACGGEICAEEDLLGLMQLVIIR